MKLLLAPPVKGATLKGKNFDLNRKEFATPGSRFFPFRLQPFRAGPFPEEVWAQLFKASFA